MGFGIDREILVQMYSSYVNIVVDDTSNPFGFIANNLFTRDKRDAVRRGAKIAFPSYEAKYEPINCNFGAFLSIFDAVLILITMNRLQT